MNKTADGRFWAMFPPQGVVKLLFEDCGDHAMGRALAATIVTVAAVAAASSVAAAVSAGAGTLSIGAVSIGAVSIGSPPSALSRIASQTAAADMTQTLDVARQGAEHVLALARAWLTEGLVRAPALMVGLGLLLAMPVLVTVGYILQRRRAAERAVVAAKACATGATDIDTTRAVTEGMAWPADAFLFIDGGNGSGKPVGRELLRIGREDDNDLCLEHPTVHRYHAVVRRTPESDFIVVDLSSRDGNGVLVNGERVAQARLRSGDVIGLGEMRLRFETRPA